MVSECLACARSVSAQRVVCSWCHARMPNAVRSAHERTWMRRVVDYAEHRDALARVFDWCREARAANDEIR